MKDLVGSPPTNQDRESAKDQKAAGQTTAHSPLHSQAVWHGQKVVGTHTGIQ